MLIGTSILDWLKPRVPIGLADREIYPRPDVTLTPQPSLREGLLGWFSGKPDVTLTPQLAPERIIERLGPGGTMPLPLEERIIGNGWYKEEWATPYMARVASVVFRGPTVSIAPLIHPRLGLPKPDVTLTPQLAPERIIEKVGPGGEAPVVSPQTDLGAAPELGEWFKKNRILLVVVIVALVLLFFFLKKRRR